MLSPFGRSIMYLSVETFQESMEKMQLRVQNFSEITLNRLEEGSREMSQGGNSVKAESEQMLSKQTESEQELLIQTLG